MVVTNQTYGYRVDADDRIVAVDPLWLAFARENGAAELTEPTVLGKSLWDFMQDRALCSIYSKIHAQVRSSGHAAVIPFRCDSPTLRRYMRMTITPGDAGSLIYESRIQRVVPQRYLGLLDGKLTRTDSQLKVCSGCKRAMLESVGWLDLEDICFRTGLLEQQDLPQLYHTICPACAEAMKQSVGNYDVA